MTINSLNLTQNLITSNRKANPQVAFKGNAPDLDALREKQDEFRRMSEQTGSQGGIIGKLSGFAVKAIGIIIAFSATKICLEKAANMIGSQAANIADKFSKSASEKAAKAAEKATEQVAEKVGEEAAKKAAEKAAQLAAKSEKVFNMVEKAKAIGGKVTDIAVNVVAGGAAVGVAMKDLGLVKKQVSNNTETLVDKAVDKANGNDYNYDGYSSYDRNDRYDRDYNNDDSYDRSDDPDDFSVGNDEF